MIPIHPNMMKNLILTFCLTATSLGGNILESQAAESGKQEWKVYSASSICRDATKFYSGRVTANEYGHIEVHNTSTVRMSCGIVRDNTSSRNGIYGIRVYYGDNSSLRNVTCKTKSFDGYGRELAKSSEKSSSGIGEGSMWLAGPNRSNYGSGHYLLTCDVPGLSSGKRSFLKAIYVLENK